MDIVALCCEGAGLWLKGGARPRGSFISRGLSGSTVSCVKSASFDGSWHKFGSQSGEPHTGAIEDFNKVTQGTVL